MTKKKIISLFAAISLALPLLATGPLPATALDNSYWSSDPGAVSRNASTITMNVRSEPNYPFERAWGKNMSIRNDRVYLVSFDAKADSQTVGGGVPVSFRLHRATAPWNRLSAERTVRLDAATRRYTVRLPATGDETNGTLSVWVGHEAARYVFSNVNVTAEYDPADDGNDDGDVSGDTEARYGFDAKWWSNQNGIDRDRTVIHHDVWGLPRNPWEIAWGRDLSVRQDRRYVLSFDADADSYAPRRSSVPISVRLYQNRSPWTRYSEEKTVTLDGTRRHYEVTLTADRTDANAAIAVYTGHAKADYRFWNISLTVTGRDDRDDRCDGRWLNGRWYENWCDDRDDDEWDDSGSWHLGNEWWTRRSGDLDRQDRSFIFTVPNRPANASDAAWGRDLDLDESDTIILRFDARAERSSGLSDLPVSVRLYRNYSPWTRLSPEKTIRLSEDWQHFEVRLTANDQEPNAAIAVWVGHETGTYQFRNLELEERH